MDATDDFADAILQAPLGVAILASIEDLFNQAVKAYQQDDCSPDRIETAVGYVTRMSIGELASLSVQTADSYVGPWNPRAPANAEQAYRDAQRRAPIATAIAKRFGEGLHRPLVHCAQEFWTTSRRRAQDRPLVFRDFERVYGAGQFTWAGLWTVTKPPEVAYTSLIHAWEMYHGPVERWRMRPLNDVRLYEINRPVDWTELVTAHPSRAMSNREAWELPNQDRDNSKLVGLLGTEGQRAARAAIRTHLVPDWRSVAEQYDGVHLSWAGFITSEGCITDLGDGDVTMLRYWYSERTLWLADVFSEMEPLPPPVLVDGEFDSEQPHERY